MYSAAIIFVCVRALFNVVIQQQTASRGKPTRHYEKLLLIVVKQLDSRQSPQTKMKEVFPFLNNRQKKGKLLLLTRIYFKFDFFDHDDDNSDTFILLWWWLRHNNVIELLSIVTVFML